MIGDKKIILSGIQPTGVPTLGNYIGAVRNWPLLQADDTLCYYCVADLHSITVRQDPSALRKRRYEMAVLLLAAGIDPERSVLFMQSHVPEHTQLSWVLNCFTYMGELNRMTQFKDKSAKHADNINAGLYTYPVLMAADILLYGTDLVPVGKDQRQHLEIARDIAIRFNNVYDSEIFTIPEGFIPKIGGCIMSLQNPDKKMSKSDTNPNGFVSLTDSADVIRSKFKRAVTDSESRIVFDESKPGVSNLLSIYTIMTGKSMKEAEAEFEGLGYGQLKSAVAESVIEELKPIQQKIAEIGANKDYVESVLKDGAEKASAQASRLLRKVYRKVGFN